MAEKKVVDLTDREALNELDLNELYDLNTKVMNERDRLKDGARLITSLIDEKVLELDKEYPVGETIAPEGIDSEESVHEG